MADGVTFFALQVALPVRDATWLHDEACQQVDHAPGTVEPADMQAFLKSIAAWLVGRSWALQYGNWEFERSDAGLHYRNWTAELEDDAPTTPPAPARPRPGAGPTGRGVPRPAKVPIDLFVLTIVLQTPTGWSADLALGLACDVPSVDWFQRQTFIDLARCLQGLDVERLSGLAIYVHPGPLATAFLTSDTIEDAWDLRAVRG